MPKRTGQSGKMYLDASGVGGSTWALIGPVQEPGNTDERAEVEINDRDSIFTKVLLGQRNMSADVTVTVNEDDTEWVALETAFNAGSDIGIAVMTEAIATVGSRGPQFDAKVTKFNRSEPIDGVMAIEMTLRPSAESTTEPAYVIVSE